MTGERVADTPPPSPAQPHATDVAHAAEKPVSLVRRATIRAQKKPAEAGNDEIRMRNDEEEAENFRCTELR